MRERQKEINRRRKRREETLRGKNKVEKAKATNKGK